MSILPQDPQTLVEEAESPPPYRNPHLQDLAEQDFQQWRHHPVTQALLLYQAHQMLDFRRLVGDLFVANNLDRIDTGELRGRILAARELCTLTLSGIKRFYEDSQPDSPKPE